jgi:hypothetical protein
LGFFFARFSFLFSPSVVWFNFFIAFWGVKKRDKKNARKSPQLPKEVVTYVTFFFPRCPLAPRLRGAPKKKKRNGGLSGRWPINQVGTFLGFFFYFCVFFNGVFVRFSTRGVQKHHQKLFGENLCQNLLAEKVEKKTFFPFVFSHRNFFYRVFGRFST